MNPNTIKTQTDAFKVRNAYLANLQAEQRNLDKTGRAVAVLQQTGQTPLPPQDTRTVTEKLSDIQKLKIDLRKQLLSITDGTEVGKIMAELGDDEVQQASMLLSDVISQLKPKYPLGVPAPVFIEFLRRYLRDFNRNVGLASGNQEELANELRLTNAQIGSQVLPNQQTMIDLLRVISGVNPPPPPPASAASGVVNREMVRQARLKAFVMEETKKLADSLPDPEVFAVMDGILDETERRQANEL